MDYAAGDEYDYFAKVIGVSQCYSIKRGCIKEGYGGTFYGIFVGSKISWFRDMGYYVFESDIQDEILLLPSIGETVYFLHQMPPISP